MVASQYPDQRATTSISLPTSTGPRRTRRPAAVWRARYAHRSYGRLLQNACHAQTGQPVAPPARQCHGLPSGTRVDPLSERSAGLPR